jgi:hypothetical protein
MIDLRYLGLTLIAIFLALAIGLMTGSALGSPERQAAVFQSLQNQFEELRTQNQQVRDESDDVRRRLTASDQALREFVPVAVKNRLPASTIGVILCGGVDERSFWGDLETALREAGASIGPVVRISDTPRPLSVGLRERLIAASGNAPATARPDRMESASWVVWALAREGRRALLEEIVREAGLELRGDSSQPVRRLLLITTVLDEVRATSVAAGEVPEKWAVDAALADPVIRMVAAEPEETKGSAVDPLRRRNIPTVDNIDTAAGQISAILALAGADGHFGSKPGATRALPPMEP